MGETFTIKGLRAPGASPACTTCDSKRRSPNCLRPSGKTEKVRPCGSHSPGKCRRIDTWAMSEGSELPYVPSFVPLSTRLVDCSLPGGEPLRPENISESASGPSGKPPGKGLAGQANLRRETSTMSGLRRSGSIESFCIAVLFSVCHSSSGCPIRLCGRRRPVLDGGL